MAGVLGRSALRLSDGAYHFFAVDDLFAALLARLAARAPQLQRALRALIYEAGQCDQEATANLRRNSHLRFFRRRDTTLRQLLAGSTVISALWRKYCGYIAAHVCAVRFVSIEFADAEHLQSNANENGAVW